MSEKVNNGKKYKLKWTQCQGQLLIWLKICQSIKELMSKFKWMMNNIKKFKTKERNKGK
jgi:hypothetical protein